MMSTKTKMALAGLMILFATASVAEAPEQERRLMDTATRIVAHLDAAEWTAPRAYFNRTMADSLSPERMEEIWKSLPQQVGARVSQGQTRIERVGDVPVAVVPLQFSLMWLDIRMPFDTAGLVAGFFIVPGSPPPLPPGGEGLDERNVTIDSGGLPLPGVLTTPLGVGPFPLVVMVHGSGPQDRDQTIGGVRMFRDIAHGLARQGVASLRYDKRTKVHPLTFTGAYTVREEVIADAIAAVALASTLDEVDATRIVVFGHSLGAMLAPRVVADAGHVAGLAMAAAPARPLEDLIIDQVDYLLSLISEVRPDQRVQRDMVASQVAQVKGLGAEDPAGPMLLNMPPAYWRDLKQYDARQAVVALGRLPVLLQHGGRDYQVTDIDFNLWDETLTASNHTLKRYPALNHLLVAGDGPSVPQEYFREANVDAGFIEDLAQWVLGVGGQ